MFFAHAGHLELRSSIFLNPNNYTLFPSRWKASRISLVPIYSKKIGSAAPRQSWPWWWSARRCCVNSNWFRRFISMTDAFSLIFFNYMILRFNSVERSAPSELAIGVNLTLAFLASGTFYSKKWRQQILLYRLAMLTSTYFKIERSKPDVSNFKATDTNLQL